MRCRALWRDLLPVALAIRLRAMLEAAHRTWCRAPDMGTTQSWIMCRLRIKCFLLSSWVDLNQYVGIRLSRELILSQFPGKSLEPWVDLNQYLGICLSRELILGQIPGVPLESWVELIQLSEIVLESWVDSNQFLRRIFESKAKKVTPSQMGPSQMGQMGSPSRTGQAKKRSYWVKSSGTGAQS